MPSTNFIHAFDNGLTLVAEPMDWLESAAFALLVPAGCSRDPDDLPGLGNLLCEMIQRGCGERDSRQFIEDLENLGMDPSASVSNAHTSFGGAMPAENLYQALDIHADLVRQPHIPEDQLEDARLSCLQEIRSLEDDLAQKVMIELRKQRYPDPFGRSSSGTLEAVERITIDDLRRQFETYFQPQGAILSVAGKIDWPSLQSQVEELFADWPARPPVPIQETSPTDRNRHLEHDSSQTHIGLAFPGVAYRDANYYDARAAIGVLSDGMSSRLFTEVREKRGLCYAVYASCHSLVDRGSVFAYAGTTTERAQETLDVMLAEIRRLEQGVEQDELDRLKVKLKSSLIMQQESSGSRSGTLAANWYFLGRLQSVEEVGRIIDNLSRQKINDYLAANPPRDFTLVTLGGPKLQIGP